MTRVVVVGLVSGLICACNRSGGLTDDSDTDLVDTDASVETDTVDESDAVTEPDSVAQFSGEQGENNWYYGYIEPGGSGEFELMTNYRVDPEYGAIWSIEPTSYWTQLRDVDAHGNGQTTTGEGHVSIEHWAVRRWVSPVEGEVTLHVTFAKVNNDPTGNGVEGRIVVDGTAEWTQFIETTDTVGVTTTVPVTVHVGSTVDFVLDPYLSNDIGDLSTFTAAITLPE
jgi:hypothetical protein